MDILERFESVAQRCVRHPSVAFDKALGAELFDERGNRYIDFHAGRGTTAFGHNDRNVALALMEYVGSGCIVQSRDRTTVAKRAFIETFVSTILRPRELDYKILFTDPSPGVATEIALRLARRQKQRPNIISFINCYHGLTEGALSITYKTSRFDSSELKNGRTFMPFPGHFGGDFDTLEYLRHSLKDSEPPAAIIVETAQVEGGMQIASDAWLRGLGQLCIDLEILLIVDETQTGGGRLGSYFSFERAGLQPDIVLMPCAMAGGLPISMLLVRTELDRTRGGEEVGIFQGDNLAFVAAKELLSPWAENCVASSVARRAEIISRALSGLPAQFPAHRIDVRGRGLMWGIEFGRSAAASIVAAWAFERGLLVEPAWIREDVLLVTPPLAIEEDVLQSGLALLTDVIGAFLKH